MGLPGKDHQGLRVLKAKLYNELAVSYYGYSICLPVLIVRVVLYSSRRMLSDIEPLVFMFG
jgi:hypothetical protein